MSVYIALFYTYMFLVFHGSFCNFNFLVFDFGVIINADVTTSSLAYLFGPFWLRQVTVIFITVWVTALLHCCILTSRQAVKRFSETSVNKIWWGSWCSSLLSSWQFHACGSLKHKVDRKWYDLFITVTIIWKHTPHSHTRQNCEELFMSCICRRISLNSQPLFGSFPQSFRLPSYCILHQAEST